MVQTKPLNYESFKKLQEASELPKKVADTMKKQKCDDFFTRVKQMYEQSLKCAREGDNETAYIYAYRACLISKLLGTHKDFKSWKDTKQGANFMQLFGLSLSTCEELEDKLIEGFASKENKNKVSPSPAVQSKSSVVSQLSVSDLVTSKKISPKDLIRALEASSSGKSALLIDYRDDRHRVIKYPKPHFIEVIHMPSNFIKPGCIFNSLVQQMDVSQRSTFCQLPKYDLVVVMDRSDPAYSPDGDLVINSKANILCEALHTYNQTCKPKHYPIVLEGGFEKWNLQYPTYTAENTPTRKESVVEENYNDKMRRLSQRYGIGIGWSMEFKEEMPQPGAREMGSNAYPSLPSSNVPSQSQGEKPVRPPPPSSLPYDANTPSANSNGFPTSSSSTSSLQFIDQHPQPSVKEVSYGIYPPSPSIPSSATKPTTAPIPPPRPSIPSLDRSTKPAFPPGPAVLGGEKPGILKPINGAMMPPGVQRPSPPPRLDRSTKPSLIDDQLESELRRYYTDMARDLAEGARGGPGSPGRTGLYNMGNTCFMNAALQCLFQTPGLHDIFNRNTFMNYVNPHNKMGFRGMMAAVFSAFMDAVWSGQFAKLRPQHFLYMFSDVNDVFCDGKQHDSQEFQMFLVDALHEDTNRVTAPQPFEQNYEGGASIVADGRDFVEKTRRLAHSPMNDIFSMKTVSELKCRSCGKTSAMFEEASLVSLELPEYTDRTTLMKCFASHFSKEILDGDARWNCPNCKRRQPAEKTTKLWHLPSVMVVHLKRFAITNGGTVKNSMPVDFDVHSLNVNEFLHERSTTKRELYTLYAVTNHRGTLNSGHYTAVAKHAKTDVWHRFDDETVSETNGRFDTSDAFMLYYKKQGL